MPEVYAENHIKTFYDANRIIMRYVLFRIKWRSLLASLARSPAQIGFVIQQARKARGWSQTDLAREAGLRQEMISKIEAGQPGSRIASICDLLAALDLELSVTPRTLSSEADIEAVF